MPQVSKRLLTPSIEKRLSEVATNTLLQASQSKDQALINILLTPTERIMLAKRVCILYLIEKEYDYRAISDLLKVSTGIIAKMKLLLNSQHSMVTTVQQRLVDEQRTSEFLNDLDAKIKLLIPPKGQKWSQWTTNIHKQKANRQKPF